MSEPSVCPNCGSSNMEHHYDGTFTPDGWICIDCQHIDRTKQAPDVPKFPQIGIKTLRKAWWEK